MDQILTRLLTHDPMPPPLADIDAWWTQHRRVTHGLSRSVHRAMVGGFAADRPAYAFASGYQEALRRLVPDLGPHTWALCATEVGGTHPRAIQTTLEPEDQGWRMSGHKQWATLGPHAHGFMVFASVGMDDEGRNRLAAVRVPADRPGVHVETMPETPFVPEIPHARLRLDRVRVEPDERLPGDAFERYLKPFRTIEDCHVHAALLAWILQVARRTSWPRDLVERLLVLLVALSGLDDADMTSPAIHIGLSGLMLDSAALLAACEPHWGQMDAQSHARWQRDRALLGVAGNARARRRDVAWQRLTAK